MWIGLLRIFLALNGYLLFCNPASSHGTTDWSWCMYKVYTDRKSWFEAKALCEHYNMSLADFKDTDQYDSLWSLIPTSLTDLYTDLPNELWLGAYHTKACGATFQSETENGEEEACMKVLRGQTSYTTEKCTEQLPFLCQNSTIDHSHCYTYTTVIRGATTIDGIFSRIEQTDCYLKCKQNCFAVRYDGTTCVRLAISGTTDYAKGTLYIKDVLRTVPTDVTPSITKHEAACSRQISTNQPLPEIEMTSFLYTDSSFIGATVEPVPSSTTTKLTETNVMSATPPLSDDVTSVNLETSSYPTDSENTEASSVSCTTCSCIRPTSVVNAEQLEKQIEQLKKELMVDKTKLSSWKRKLTSAADDRQSSANIGYVAILVLCAVPVFIILADLGRFIQYLKSFKSRVRNHPN